ncbi:SAM-dependent methyltransferase [Alkalihalobacillus sp. CinArs1]|uniref:SAM-dependent methyltransferase n=1 Tax=Alkalihalobacillus sp. CinArs1 TaxID=2995314 RepID=UPI0022DCEB8F|nr:SAM-dependent methyltransferase [Alkalihalobacillus sp. CinArs1]
MSILTKIKSEIANSAEKAISYERFMEISLYDEEGYYGTNRKKTGKAGDFYTSPGVHEVFSRVMGRALATAIETDVLHPSIVEIGAGEGEFLLSCLDEIQSFDKELYKRLTYYVVETSPYHRKIIENKTKNLDKVMVYSSIEELKSELKSFEGIIFSNELLDAFPVRVVEKKNGMLYEVLIGLSEIDGKLIEVYKPCTDSAILIWIENYGFLMNEGQRIEVPLYMMSWFISIANWMKKGRIYTIDYGYTDDEWNHPARSSGSLRGYYKHQLVQNPLENIGEMDLTTHIPLDALRRIGEEHHFRCLECEVQGRFLVNHGLLDFVEDNRENDPFSPVHKKNRAVNWLSQMNQFQVVVQQK